MATADCILKILAAEFRCLTFDEFYKKYSLNVIGGVCRGSEKSCGTREGSMYPAVWSGRWVL